MAVWPSPAAAEEPPGGWYSASCEKQICLVVADKTNDTDGDGVSDVDEERLGTDPKDPTSKPPTMDDKLPSVEELDDLASTPEQVGETLHVRFWFLRNPGQDPRTADTSGWEVTHQAPPRGPRLGNTPTPSCCRPS